MKELTTSRKCDPELWDQKSERAYGKGGYIKELNNHFSTLKVKVFEARLLLIENNTIVTAESIKNLLIGKVEKSKTIAEVFKNHNDQLAALIGSDYSPETLRRYKICFGHTLSFIKWKYGIEDLEISKLNYEFLTDYLFWLKTVGKCNHNTSMKYIRNFRKIVNGSIRRGWLTRDPFLGFKMSMEEVKITPLSKEELKALSEKDFSCARLDQVKDIFLFCCFTGLAYVDIKKLKRSEIVVGIDEEKWIFTTRQKTSTASRIPILPTAQLIMEKYADHIQCINNNRLLPFLSNKK
jgi:hypothetical protein